MSYLETTRCVVLNSSYEPLTLVTAKRALTMYYEGKVDVIEEHPTLIVHSEDDVWPVPTAVILRHYVNARTPYGKPAMLTQKNLFIRDKFTCQYCNRHRSDLADNEKLTRDHVFPKEKGGRDEWNNVVTACSTCNNRKANYLLGSFQCDFRLEKNPTTPTVYEIWSKSGFRKFG